MVGLGLCGGGFGSLPRPGVVDSVGLGLCRGLGWLNRWLGVVVGSPKVELSLKLVEPCYLVAEKILVSEINLTVGYFYFGC